MLLKKYLAICLLFLTFSGCSLLEPEIVQKTRYVQRNINIVSHPNKLVMKPVHFYVVTPKNFFQFKKDFTKTHDKFVFLALSLKDYENLSLNMSEIKRYIEQQKDIILYYESAVSADANITKNK